MAITFDYGLDEDGRMLVNARAWVQTDPLKVYRLVLSLTKKAERNPIVIGDVILVNGAGRAQVSYDYSLHNQKGIDLAVNALVTCYVPRPEQEGESTVPCPPESISGELVENLSEDIHLFGVMDCLDSIDVEHTQSLRYTTENTGFDLADRLQAQLQLKDGYALLGFQNKSFQLNYKNSLGHQVTPDFTVTTSSNQVDFRIHRFPAAVTAECSFFRWSGVGIVCHIPTGRLQALTFTCSSGGIS